MGWTLVSGLTEMASLLEGDGEMKSGNQFSVDQTIMAKCMVGWEARIAENPVRETSGAFPCSLSLLLMGDLKEPRHGENGLLMGISKRLDCAGPRDSGVECLLRRTRSRRGWDQKRGGRDCRDCREGLKGRAHRLTVPCPHPTPTGLQP